MSPLLPSVDVCDLHVGDSVLLSESTEQTAFVGKRSDRQHVGFGEFRPIRFLASWKPLWMSFPAVAIAASMVLGKAVASCNAIWRSSFLHHVMTILTNRTKPKMCWIYAFRNIAPVAYKRFLRYWAYEIFIGPSVSMNGISVLPKCSVSMPRYAFGAVGSSPYPTSA